MLANGHDVKLYVHELEGARPGPTVGLVAGIHGDEPLCIEMVRQVLEGIAPADLAGSLLAISAANPYAIQAATRNTPLDMSNLNRVFPGDPDGMLTEQLAHAIVTRFLPRCSHLIDMHSGGNLATVDYLYIYAGDLPFSKSFGSEYYFRHEHFGGTLTGEALGRNIPALVVELGGGGQLNQYYIDKGVRGVRNVLKHLQMIAGEPEVPAEQWVFTKLVTLRPHAGGILRSNIDTEQLRSRVPGGTVLGEIYNPYTFDVLETMRAPFEDSILILGRATVTKVDPGDFGFMVADGATAERI
jgi:predicted deacylase